MPARSRVGQSCPKPFRCKVLPRYCHHVSEAEAERINEADQRQLEKNIYRTGSIQCLSNCHIELLLLLNSKLGFSLCYLRDYFVAKIPTYATRERHNEPHSG